MQRSQVQEYGRTGRNMAKTSGKTGLSRTRTKPRAGWAIETAGLQHARRRNAYAADHCGVDAAAAALAAEPPGMRKAASEAIAS